MNTSLYNACAMLSNAHVSYGYFIFKPYLAKKTATKFSTEDSIYKNEPWKRIVEFKPGAT